MKSRAAALLLVALAAGPARADTAAEEAAIAAWRRLLDVPLARTAAHDLRWVVEPGAPTPPAGLDAAGLARWRTAAIAATQSTSFVASPAPIDLARLKYLGYVKPRTCAPFDAVHRVPLALLRPYHVYRYGRHYVLTASDGRREQLAVYAVARALELLAARFPAAYRELFTGPRTPNAQLARIRAYDAKKPVSFVNMTRCFAFVIDGGYPAIAKSSLALGTRKPQDLTWRGARVPGVGVFENVARVHLNLTAMQGYGSRNLYRDPDLVRDFLRYLRDGLVETLTHEALHCLLRRDKNVRPLFWAIVHTARHQCGPRVGKSAEEALVSNVSTRLFLGRPGLSPVVAKYYQRLFRTQHRRNVGLVAGHETKPGLRLRALLRRETRAPHADYERLLRFDLLEPGSRSR